MAYTLEFNDIISDDSAGNHSKDIMSSKTLSADNGKILMMDRNEDHSSIMHLNGMGDEVKEMLPDGFKFHDDVEVASLNGRDAHVHSDPTFDFGISTRRTCGSVEDAPISDSSPTSNADTMEEQFSTDDGPHVSMEEQASTDDGSDVSLHVYLNHVTGGNIPSGPENIL